MINCGRAYRIYPAGIAGEMIRDRYLSVAKPPASTFVVVSRLMRPGWLIEIEAVAAIDD